MEERVLVTTKVSTKCYATLDASGTLVKIELYDDLCPVDVKKLAKHEFEFIQAAAREASRYDYD